VLQLGPLWANSSFEFEDANGDLKAMFHGSQNVDMQIVTSISAMQRLPDLSRRLEKDSPAEKFYSELKFGAQSKSTPIGQNIFKLGAASKCTLAENVKNKLIQVLGLTPFGTVKKFNRIKIGRQVFHSKAYSRVYKRNSYTVVFKESGDQLESYGQIQFYLLHQPPCSHPPFHTCACCKATPFAVIWRLEPEGSVQFADCESDITLNHIQAVKKPR